MTSSFPARTKIFVSYSHNDVEHLERLKVHLTPYLGGTEIADWLWDDMQILTGSKWSEDIQRALQSVDAAILLVDADFLASRFIRQHELPPLLEAAEQRGVLIMPVILGPCAFTDTRDLSRFQAANNPSEPLTRLRRGYPREEWWRRVARNISQALLAQQAKRLSAASPQTSKDAPSVDATQAQSAPDPPSPSIYESLPDASETLLARYMEKLRCDPEITELQILDMNRPLQVTEIYVKVRLSQQMRSRPERGKEQQQWHDPQTFMRQQELWLERRTATAIDPAIAIQRYHYCVVVGDPGAGKTTMLKRLALLALNHELPGLPALPLYIKLHEVARAGSDDLLEFAATAWERTYGLPKLQAAQVLAEHMETGNVLLLLDALDETVIGDDLARAEESYRRIEQAILRLTQRYHRVPIMVTARKEGYRQRGPLTGFTKLEVLDFLPEQIEQFITNWFEHYGDEGRPGLATGLIAALHRNLRMARLAANPLLLSLIVLAYEDNDQQLPENRAWLYQQCVNTLLHKWDAQRRIQRFRAFSSEDQKHLLPRIAWHFHSQGLRYFPASQLIPIIADFLLMRGKSAEQAQDVLQAISGDDGLLREQGDNVYGFLHLTLQEYFAAQAVGDPSSLLAHLGDPWWEEVILLYAGQAHDATPLLDHLLTFNGPGEIVEDIFAGKLMLAGRCLAAHPTLQKVQLWHEIPDLLFRMLRYTEYALTRQQAAQTLTQIGYAYPEQKINTHLLVLLKDAACRKTVRISIAEALADFGSRDLAPDVLTFFVAEGARLDEELREYVQKTISMLADRRLLPRLLELISNSQSDPLVLIGLANVLEAVGDAHTARLLLPLLSDVHFDQPIRVALARSTGALADAATISSLLRLIADPGIDEEVAINALLAISIRDYRPAIPELLSLLSQRQIRQNILVGITYVLSRFGDETIADQLAALAADPELDYTVRALCLAAFAICGLRTRQREIIDMLSEVHTDEYFREQIAMGLAEVVDQGDRTLLEKMRSIYVREHNASVKFYLMIVLSLLGELSVLPQLRAVFAQETFPQYRRGRVAALIVEHTPARDLVALLAESSGKVALPARIAIAEAIGEVGTAALVPELFTVLEDQVVIEEVRIAIAEAIGLLGETPETVERLLRLWQSLQLRDPLHLSALVDQLYEAMWSVSRRAGVIVVQEGATCRVIDRA